MMRRGRIEVICGSMFSGKTEELIRKIETSRVRPPKRRNIQTIHRHTLCRTRRGVARRKLHSSTPVDSSASILLLGSDTDVVGIDEAQFFDENLIDVCNELANRGTRVIVAGLDLDFKGVPFGPMPGLCAVADEVTKVHAICVRCGALAYVSHRTVDDEKRVLLGEQTAYEPLCRACYQKAIEKDNLKHQV